MIIEMNCSECGRAVALKVRDEDWVRRRNGELVQHCFPYLSAAEREMFVSGVCGECWETMFGSDE